MSETSVPPNGRATLSVINGNGRGPEPSRLTDVVVTYPGPHMKDGTAAGTQTVRTVTGAELVGLIETRDALQATAAR
jgi:hypothetical protein